MYRKYVKEIHDDYILTISGTKLYYKDNIMHKAVVKSGIVYYYNEFGELHRLDGPAVEYPSGDKTYWINNMLYKYEYWLEKVKEYV